MMPTLEIHKTNFVYTKERNSYLGKGDKRSRFISRGLILQSSIDSILSLIKDLKDSTVMLFNPCIMSGVLVFITVTDGSDTTRFTLHNSTGHVVVKILDILNHYLPKNNQLHNLVDLIREEEACWEYLMKEVEDRSRDNNLYVGSSLLLSPGCLKTR
jgi:hypothetical protein